MTTNIWSENLTTQYLLNENDALIPHNKVARWRCWENRVESANDEMHSPNNYWEATGTPQGCWGLGGSHWIRDEDPRSHGSQILINVRSIPLVSLLWVFRWFQKMLTCLEYFRGSSQANPVSLWPHGGFLSRSYLFSSCSFFLLLVVLMSYEYHIQLTPEQLYACCVVYVCCYGYVWIFFGS